MPPGTHPPLFMTLKNTPTFLFALLVAVIVFAVTALVVTQTRGDAPASETDPGALGGARGAESTISRAQAALADDPADAAALSALAEASLVRARETGDPSWHTRAEEAARRALAADPRRFTAMDALGSLALTRHRFEEALSWSRRSLAVAPGRVDPIAIRADAQIELGRYAQGFAAVQRRMELRPDLPSYSRASYARELQGDRAGAIRLMELAAGAGALGSPDRAFAQVQLGLLRFGGGDLAAAEREMRMALAERPDDAPATAGLARVLAARGDLDRAAALYSRAIDLLPLPEYPAALADVHRALGRAEAAREDLALAEAMQDAAGRQRLRRQPRRRPHPGRRPRPDGGRHRPGAPRPAGAPGRDRRPGAGLGAHPGRPVRRGQRPRDAEPAPGHPGRPDALPRRDGRVLRRRLRRGARAAVAGARAEPRLLRPLGAGRPARAREPAGMRRALLALVALGALAALLVGGVTSAAAHPLGNFTVNSYLRVEASGGELYLRQVVDMAEIPTFRERSAVEDAGGLAPYAAARARERAAEIALRVNGRPVAAEPVSADRELPRRPGRPAGAALRRLVPGPAGGRRPGRRPPGRTSPSRPTATAWAGTSWWCAPRAAPARPAPPPRPRTSATSCAPTPRTCCRARWS